MMIPQDFIHQLQNEHSLYAQKIIDAIKEGNAPISIRINKKKAQLQDFEHLPQVPWCNKGFYLNYRPVFSKDIKWHQGIYYVQEASSMFLDYILNQVFPANQRSAKKVLDLCAAPGGKTTLLVDFFDDNSLIIANELIPNRLAILRENLGRYGVLNVISTGVKPEVFANKTPNFFDVILVDAPCSGEGLFRKDNAAMKEWSYNTINMCKHKQRDILVQAVGALADNGVLIYSTCTFNKIENDENVAFIENNLGLERISVIDENLEKLGVVVENGIYRFFPGWVQGEGFFLSIFKKKEYSQTHNVKFGAKPFKKSKPNHYWFSDFNQFAVYESDSRYFILREKVSDWAEDLATLMNLKFFGTPLGELKGKDFVPAQEAVMAGVFEGLIDYYELNEADALSFLRKENFEFNSDKKGWQILIFKNQPIGFVKNLGKGRFNNYLPKYWRLRLTD